MLRAAKCFDDVYGGRAATPAALLPHDSTAGLRSRPAAGPESTPDRAAHFFGNTVHERRVASARPRVVCCCSCGDDRSALVQSAGDGLPILTHRRQRESSVRSRLRDRGVTFAFAVPRTLRWPTRPRAAVLVALPYLRPHPRDGWSAPRGLSCGPTTPPSPSSRPTPSGTPQCARLGRLPGLNSGADAAGTAVSSIVVYRVSADAERQRRVYPPPASRVWFVWSVRPRVTVWRRLPLRSRLRRRATGAGVRLARLRPTWSGTARSGRRPLAGPALVHRAVSDGALLAALRGVAVVLLALWRARRLGRSLRAAPVVVRAAEAVEGRARLYHRGRARDSAAAALRETALERLLPLIGLPPGADQRTVIDAVAARAGRPAGDVSVLLYGAAPSDDRSLVHLADDLDALEREVRRS